MEQLLDGLSGLDLGNYKFLKYGCGGKGDDTGDDKVSFNTAQYPRTALPATLSRLHKSIFFTAHVYWDCTCSCAQV